MIPLSSFLTSERTFMGALGHSKKKALQSVSEIIQKHYDQLSSEKIFESLIGRERLGSTGFGNGVAIPHCRMAELSEPLVFLFRLSEGIDFEAMDAKPVDLLVVLLVPEQATQDHLDLLGQIAGQFNDSKRLQKMRESADQAALYHAFLS